MKINGLVKTGIEGMPLREQGCVNSKGKEEDHPRLAFISLTRVIAGRSSEYHPDYGVPESDPKPDPDDMPAYAIPDYGIRPEPPYAAPPPIEEE